MTKVYLMPSKVKCHTLLQEVEVSGWRYGEKSKIFLTEWANERALMYRTYYRKKSLVQHCCRTKRGCHFINASASTATDAQ